MDATCNGYQHFSFLLGEDSLASQVNIINRNKQNYPEDFYTYKFIAIKCADYLKECLKEEKYKITQKDSAMPDYNSIKKRIKFKINKKKDLYKKIKELDELEGLDAKIKEFEKDKDKKITKNLKKL